MIRILPYREDMRDAVRELAPELYREYLSHGDVRTDTASVLLCDKFVVGFGFLLNGPSFGQITTRELPYYHIHFEHFVASDEFLEQLFLPKLLAGEEVPEDAEEENWSGLYLTLNDALIECLKEHFQRIQASYPGKRLLLRTWVRGDNAGLLEYEMEHGFTVTRVMPEMTAWPELLRDALESRDEELPDSGETLEFTVPNSECEIVIRSVKPTEAFWKEYLSANEECFTVPDSRNELEYKLLDKNTKVFAAFFGETLISSVSVWRVDENTAATENIFCRPEYRRLGITTVLLEYVFDYLMQAGYECARLSLFPDALPAFSLYEGLGYTVTGTVLELCFEENRVPVMY